MSFATWLLYLATDIALSLTPGPAVLFVVGTALRHGLRASLGGNLGILFANTLYFVASAAGLGVLLATAEPVFVFLKYAGAAYLVWLGIAAFRAASRAKDRALRPEPSAETVENRDVFDKPTRATALASDAKADASQFERTDSRRASADGSGRSAREAQASDLRIFGFWAAFRAATLLQLGNPKAILFFTALLPQFVDPSGAWPVPLQIAALAVTGVVAEFFVLLFYGAIAARAAAATQSPQMLAAFERASGLCLIGCAALALAA